jgi:hypothetical protein
MRLEGWGGLALRDASLRDAPQGEAGREKTRSYFPFFSVSKLGALAT